MKTSTGWILGACIALGGFAVPLAAAPTALAAPHASAPDFSLPRISEKAAAPLKLSDYKGKVVLVNFWATWCPPCREEIPDFIAVRDALNAEGFEILGIAMDDGGAKVVAPFAKEYGITYPLAVGNKDVTKRYGGIRGIPTSFLIDREGRIVQKWVGMINRQTLETAVTKLL